MVQYLEWREKQYDLRVRVDVFGRESSAVPIVKGALTYIASADCVKNLNYAGMQPIPPLDHLMRPLKHSSVAVADQPW